MSDGYIGLLEVTGVSISAVAVEVAPAPTGSWSTLEAILWQATQDKQVDIDVYICPVCGDTLNVNDGGFRDCPTGDFTYPYKPTYVNRSYESIPEVESGACPICGDLLSVNGIGVRDCPSGHYQDRGTVEARI